MGGQIFAVGGSERHGNSVEAFDPLEQEWTKMAPLNKRRYDHFDAFFYEASQLFSFFFEIQRENKWGFRLQKRKLISISLIKCQNI